MSPEFERSVFACAYKSLDRDFNPDLFLGGIFYQATLSAHLRVSDEQATLFRDKKNRKGGEFYTPRWVVDLCVDNLLSRSAGVPPAFPRADSSRCNFDLRTIDPAVGCGNFLIGLFERFVEKECRQDGGDPVVLQFIANGLHGRDTDGRAVAIARLLLLLCASKFLPTEPGQVQQVLPKLWSNICRNIYVCDSLVDVHTESFDVVLGNPPYLSFGARNQPKLQPNWSKLLRSTYPDSAEYKVRLHSVFQDISLRLVRDGGHVVLLVPDAFLNGCYYEKLRRLLLRKSRIVSLSELPEETFDDATAGFWCIAHYEKTNAPAPSYKVSLERIVRSKTRAQSPRDAGAPELSPQQYSVELEDMLSADRARLQMFFNDYDCNLFKRLRNCAPLSTVMRGHTGIRALAGQSTIVSTNVKAEPHCKPGIISGSEVLPFQVEWSGNYLNVNPQKLFGGGHDASVIEKPKILMRQTADKLIAAVDTSNLYHLNNVHSFAPKSSAFPIEKLFFIAGLINSSLWRYVYQLKSREVGRILAQIDIEMVEAMPLPPQLGDAQLWPQTAGGVNENIVSNLVRLLHENGNSIILTEGKRVCRRCAFKIMDRCIDQLYDISEADSNQIEQRLGHLQNIASSDAVCSHDIAKLLEFIKQELPFSKVLAHVQNA